MDPLQKAQIMTEEDLNRTYLRFAHQFLESYEDPTRLAIVGMQTRGVYIGRRIVEVIKQEFDIDIDFGVLDV
ncbi:MAG: bifunctional pyr operon transcriptional regulator/uracil phosphoribosyltransferase, partial [Balneola sp.]